MIGYHDVFELDRWSVQSMYNRYFAAICCWFQWNNSCRFIHICMHGWKLSTLVEAMAIYVYGGVRHEVRVWKLSMNLFSATGEFVFGCNNEFASSAIGSKGGMKFYGLYGVYRYPHDVGHPIFLVSGLVIRADDTSLVYTDIFMMAVILLCCFLKW